MSKVLTVVKGVGGLAISVGVGAIAKNLISHTTPASTNMIMKVCIGMGGMFLAGVGSLAASDQFDGVIDKIENTVKIWMTEEKPNDEETTEEET